MSSDLLLSVITVTWLFTVARRLLTHQVITNLMWCHMWGGVCLAAWSCAAVIHVEPAVFLPFFCQLLFWPFLDTFIIRRRFLPRNIRRPRVYLTWKMRAALRRPAELAQAQERVLQLQLEVEQEDRHAFFFRDEAPHALDGNPMLRLTRVNNPLFHEAVNSVRDAVYGINRRHRNVTALTTFEQGPQFFNGGVPGDPFQ